MKVSFKSFLLVCVCVSPGLVASCTATTAAEHRRDEHDDGRNAVLPETPEFSPVALSDRTDPRLEVADSSSAQAEPASRSLEDVSAAFAEHLVAQRVPQNSGDEGRELYSMWLPAEYLALIQQESMTYLRSQGLVDSMVPSDMPKLEALVRGKLVLVCSSWAAAPDSQRNNFLSRSALVESLQVRLRQPDGEATPLRASAQVHPFAAKAALEFMSLLAGELGGMGSHMYALFYDLPPGIDLSPGSVGAIEMSLLQYVPEGVSWRIMLPNPAWRDLESLGPDLIAKQANEFADERTASGLTALDVPKKSGGGDWRVNAQRAQVAFQRGDYVSAIRECDQVIGLLGGSKAVNDDQGKAVLLQKAISLHLLRASKLAEGVLGQIETDGNYGDPISNRKMRMLIEIYTITGRYDDAIAASGAILEQLPSARDREARRQRAATLAGLAVPLFKVGRTEESKAALIEALELVPEDDSEMQEFRAVLCSIAGNIAIEEGDPSTAAQRFKEAATIQGVALGESSPATLMSLANLCWSLDKLGETGKAKDVEAHVATLGLTAVRPSPSALGYAEINPQKGTVATASRERKQGGADEPRSDSGIGVLVMCVLYLGLAVAIGAMLGAEKSRMIAVSVTTLLLLGVVVLFVLSSEAPASRSIRPAIFPLAGLVLGFTVVKLTVRAFLKSSNRHGVPLSLPRMRAGFACLGLAAVAGPAAAFGGILAATALRGPSFATPLESCVLDAGAAVLMHVGALGVAWMMASGVGSMAKAAFRDGRKQ